MFPLRGFLTSKEYESLQFVEELALVDSLINPEESGTVPQAFRLQKPLLDFFQAKLDPYQVAAILKALRRVGFTLISGSAGSGKTEVLLFAFLLTISTFPVRSYMQHNEREMRGQQCN